MRKIDYLKPLFVKAIDFISVAVADKLGDTSELTDKQAQAKLLEIVCDLEPGATDDAKAAWVDVTSMKLLHKIKESGIAPTTIKVGDYHLGFRDPKTVSNKLMQQFDMLGKKPSLLEIAKTIYGPVKKSSIGGAYHRYIHNYNLTVGGGYDLSRFYAVENWDELTAAELEPVLNQLPAPWIVNAYQVFTRELARYRIGLAITSAKKEKKDKLVKKVQEELARFDLATSTGSTFTQPCAMMVQLELQ